MLYLENSRTDIEFDWMVNKPSKMDDNKPSDYFREVEAAQKQEKPTVSDLTTKLRADMVPSSNVQPARERIVKHESIRVAVGILLGLVIISMIIFLGIGPGRPILEHGLANLVARGITPSPSSTFSPVAPTQTPIPSTNTPVPATETPSPSPTRRPTNTQVVFVRASVTPIPPSPTEPACRDVLSITLADVGRTLCVKGTVIETINRPSGFMVIFSTDPGAFYWVSYDWVWLKAKLKTCYQITGEIFEMGNNPILLFNYHNQPEVCP